MQIQTRVVLIDDGSAVSTPLACICTDVSSHATDDDSIATQKSWQAFADEQWCEGLNCAAIPVNVT